MSEKKRGRRRKDEYSGPGEQEKEKPSKEEYKVAKWMKRHVKTKKTKFLSHNVEYFSSNKAIDALLESDFARGAAPLFTTREYAVEFLDVMLEHRFFHRAKKVPVTLEELRGVSAKEEKTEKSQSKSSNNSGGGGSKKERKDKDMKKDAEKEAEAAEASGANTDAGAAGQKERRKRKIRLDMHPEQVFVDGSEAYVWIYDPIPIHYWIYGLILLLGAIGICLFPLWPPMLRKGVYYLSVAAAGFLVFILALTVVRLIIFTIVWALSGGKLHFWIFPNLTEDVGFFASFWPLYESNYVSDNGKSKSEKSKSKKSKKKDKDSDAEGDTAADDAPLEPEKIEEIKEHDADMELRHRNVTSGGSDSGSSSNSRKPSPSGGDGAEAESVTGADLAAEEESHSSNSSAGENSEAAAETDAKCSRTSESESETISKDYEIIHKNEVQNVK